MRLPSERRVIQLATACGVMAAVIAGCGGPSRVVATGTVTYRGKPIPKGAISFLSRESSIATATSADITEGKYVVDSLGGLPVGVYQVQIVAFRPCAGASRTVIADPLNAGLGTLEQYIPKKYNVKTELKVTLEPGYHSLTRNFTLTD